MALGIYEVLHELGRIDQDALARRFASRYQAAPWRGYGAGRIVCSRRWLGASPGVRPRAHSSAAGHTAMAAQ